jgi:hypothetical protein
VERHLPRVEGSVASAVDRFLAGLELTSAGEEVLAESVRVVAARLDRADARATPALARELTELCQRLALKHREPDAVDDLRARYETRRLALQLKQRRSA